MNSKTLLLFLFTILVSPVLLAQTSSFEIRAVNKGGGYVGVEMRTVSGTPPTASRYVTDLVFGLKWLSSYNVDLVSTITSTYNVVKSDVRKTKGIYYYQAFSASNTPFVFPANWTLNNWVEIMSVRNTLNGTGVGTFEVIEAGFDITTEPNLGMDLTDYTPAVVGSAINVPLPVKLIRFEVVAANRLINLRWSTSEELNSRGFEVERAEQDSSFKSIVWVASKGTGGGDYQWQDKETISGVKYRYRLRQIDRDGAWRFSEIKTASLDMLKNGIRIMPNPVNNILQVLLGEDSRPEKVMVKIRDAKGGDVLHKTFDVSAGKKMELDVSRLAGGQYVLSVHNSGGLLFSRTFLKE